MIGTVPDFLSGVLAWGERVEASAVGVAIAESRYVFLALEGVHLIGLAFAVGLIAFIDLRLMGLILPRLSARLVIRQLRPWVIGGFAVILVSGALLFWSAAGRLIASPAFAIKLVLILLAGVNAAWFEFFGARDRKAPDDLSLPRGARFAGAASLTLWLGVVAAGRLIAYLPSWS
jgi:hypothetical protein